MTWDEVVTCIECTSKRNQIMLKVKHLRQTVKKRAIENGNTYGIYYDEEDCEPRYATRAACTERGYTVIEYISPHQ